MTGDVATVGDTVRHVDASALGTVTRLLGRRGAGGGPHARVQWDNGGTSVVRLDLLVVVR